ncbi:hypothetical protein ACFQ0T_00060 [Kitasatospora gansuensis]
MWAYTFTQGSDTVSDPFGETSTYPVITGIATSVKIGLVDYTTWPRIGSDGDLTGSGSSTMWAITQAGDIQTWTGRRTGTTTAPGWEWINYSRHRPDHQQRRRPVAPQQDRLRRYPAIRQLRHQQGPSHRRPQLDHRPQEHH